MMAKHLVLASSSPRRSQLLQLAGLSFTTARPDIDESPHPGEYPTEYVQRLSREKAFAINSADLLGSVNPSSGIVVLSADTTVADGSQILGKPSDPQDASAMLRHLSGRTHTVHTGFTVRDMDSGRAETRLVSSNVTMRALSDADLAAYVATGDPVGKAGSYAIQNRDFAPVASFEGCYANIVGLPVCMVAPLLAEFGIAITPILCSPSTLKIPCQFWHQQF